MNLEVPEAPGEGHMLARAHRLVAEEDDLVVEQGLADLADDRVGQLRRQVDPAELGADGRTDSLRVEVAPAQRGQPVPLLGEIGERTDRDGIAGEAEGVGPAGVLRRRHHRKSSPPRDPGARGAYCMAMTASASFSGSTKGVPFTSMVTDSMLPENSPGGWMSSVTGSPLL